MPDVAPVITTTLPCIARMLAEAAPRLPPAPLYSLPPPAVASSESASAKGRTTMAAISESAANELVRGCSGDLVRPGDASYDDVRKTFNGMIDRKPALIARARTTADLAATVRFAAAAGLPLAVRGGGHAIAGFSMINDAIVADCSLMNEVTVDPKARTITAGPGCRWRDVDSTAGAHGLATPGGTISSTGVAGFPLGGGLGFLAKT